MTCANKNMSPSQRENLSTEDAASVNGDRGVVAKSGGLDKSDFNLQLFPCKGQSGGNPRLVYQELSKITHKLVAVVAVLCFLVVGLLLSNIHLQMRVREFEEMVIRMRPELVLHPQKSPATEAGQEATFPARGGQHHVNPPMAGRITLWSGQSGRRKRSAQICPTFSVREMVNEYCKAKKEKIKSSEGPRQLNIAMFEAVFDTAAMSAHQKNPGRKDPNCFTNASTNITLCAGNKVIYHLEGTRLGVYSDKGRDNSNIATMKDRVTFVIKTAGIYLVNLNISIIDVTLKNYLGLFVNDRLAMACPEGGIKCSTNYDASFDFRICNINGVLKLNVNDSLDVRTMQSNTTIRIAALSNSFFTIVLLQKQL